jgi:hypothetical protein
MQTAHLTLALACGLLAGAARAESLSGSTATRDDVRLADLDPGEHWYGAEVDLDALRGKVVLFEMWGS